MGTYLRLSNASLRNKLIFTNLKEYLVIIGFSVDFSGEKMDREIVSKLS